MQYSQVIVEHFINPQNVGAWSPADKNIFTARVGTQQSGDVVQLQIKINNNVIECAKFKAYGCVPTIAACSYVTQWLKNKSIAAAVQLSSEHISEALDIPSLKMHCALLVEDAVKSAIHLHEG